MKTTSARDVKLFDEILQLESKIRQKDQTIDFLLKENERLREEMANIKHIKDTGVVINVIV